MIHFKSFLAGAMVMFLGTVCYAQTDSAPLPAKAAGKAAAKQITPAAKINLNTATQAELEKLPGIGPAMAKKIVAGRPYASPADLAKAGVPAGTVSKITPLVSVGAKPKPAIAEKVLPQAAQPSALPKAPRVAGPEKMVKPAAPPPIGKNMVWVNTESKIYHKQGSYWYGKTKSGSYMTESEAIKAGYREEKSKSKQGR